LRTPCAFPSEAARRRSVIGHNLEVIKTADWIIDLGPEGRDGGGEIVAAGTPEDVVKVKERHRAVSESGAGEEGEGREEKAGGRVG
jgi:hypothetical protein